MRPDPYGGTMTVDATPDTVSTSSYWSHTTGVSISRTQSYAINYTANGTNGTALTFTLSSNGAIGMGTLRSYATAGECVYVTSRTANSVTIKMRGWDYYTSGGGSPNVMVAVRRGTSASGTVVAQNDSNTLTTLTNTGVTLSGLSQNTTYSVWAYAATPYGGGFTSTYQMGYATFTTTPSAWSWTASNGNATAAQTSAAYTAITGNGLLTNFSYLVWNDLVDKVNAVCAFAGYSWDTTYATLANTKMTSTSKTLTAVRFNSLLFNIGSHYSTGISEVSAGDDVLGSYFTTLATKLNDWLATLYALSGGLS